MTRYYSFQPEGSSPDFKTETGGRGMTVTDLDSGAEIVLSESDAGKFTRILGEAACSARAEWCWELFNGEVEL